MNNTTEREREIQNLHVILDNHIRNKNWSYCCELAMEIGAIAEKLDQDQLANEQETLKALREMA